MPLVQGEGAGGASWAAPRPPGISRRWNWRIGAIAAAAIAAAAGLGAGISGYIGSHQSGPPPATSAGRPGAGQAVAPGATDLQALRQDFGPWRQLAGRLTDSPALPTRGRLNAGSAAAVLAAVAFGTVWIIGHNSGHNAYLASHLVSVTVAPGDQMPASSTDHMVIVSPDIATTKASQAMATGIAGQRNYSTYLQLGPATLQYVDGRMWYVFPLEFDGAGNKARLHAIEPGYIMVSAEDPNAVPVEHYDGPYSMIDPERWHGGINADHAVLRRRPHPPAGPWRVTGHGARVRRWRPPTCGYRACRRLPRRRHRCQRRRGARPARPAPGPPDGRPGPLARHSRCGQAA